MNLIKTLIFILAAGGLVVILIPSFLISHWELVASNLGAVKYLGLFLAGLGSVFYLWCAYQFSYYGKGTPAFFDPPQKFVGSGLYRFTRNPMYISLIAIVLGEAIFFGSTILLIYSASLFIYFHLFVIYYEEPHLRKVFGQEYQEYCKNVKRWL